jgi:hypothetical protein
MFCAGILARGYIDFLIYAASSCPHLSTLVGETLMLSPYHQIGHVTAHIDRASAEPTQHRCTRSDWECGWLNTPYLYVDHNR